jgi:hypothetical protein
MKKARLKNQDGSIIVSILIISMFLSVMVAAMMVYASSNLSRGKGRVLNLEAQYAAESGADSAIAYLNNDPAASYSGTGGSELTVLNNSMYKATYSTTVAAGGASNEKVITAIGKVYSPASAATPSYTRRIEVTTQRTSDLVGVTGILSRNIIELQSGVKNVYAKDLYVNGYINTNKNTTNIIAENITVAGKNTGASNCSLGGPGNLLKPAAFTSRWPTITASTPPATPAMPTLTFWPTRPVSARCNQPLYPGRSIWTALT